MITYSTTNLLEFKKGCVLMNAFGEECRTDPETKDLQLGAHIHLADGLMQPSSLTIPHQPTVKTLILYGIIYADDCVVFCGSDKGLQRMMTVLDKVTTAFGIEIAEKKNEVICNKFLVSTTQANTQPASILPAATAAFPPRKLRKNTTKLTKTTNNPQIKLGQAILAVVVQRFQYLGCQDRATASFSAEIIKREMVIIHNKRMLINPHLKPRPQLEFFKSTIVPIGIYGCEAWSATKTDIAKLERTFIRQVRDTLLMKKPDNPTYRQVLDQARYLQFSIFPLTCYIQRQRLKFANTPLTLDPPYSNEWPIVTAQPQAQRRRRSAKTIPGLHNGSITSIWRNPRSVPANY